MIARVNFYIIGFVFVCYCLFTLAHSHLFFKSQPTSLYHFLTDSFLAKRVDLLFTPPEELLILKNPRDYLQNRSIKFADGKRLHAKIHDASLYHDKFYIYFSPVPVLVFYLPIKCLTGYYPSESVTILLFITLSFMANLILLNKVKEKYFQKLDPFSIWLGSLLVGLGPNIIFLMRRPQIYEVAIAAALFFISVGTVFLFNIFHKNKCGLDIFLCSLFLTLGVASRPHFVFAVAAVIIFILYYLWTKRELTIRYATLLLLPFISIGILLATYNYIRFDSIFEFGENYQLLGNLYGTVGKIYQSDLIQTNIVYNFYGYFLKPVMFHMKPPYVFFPIFENFEFLPKRVIEKSVGLLVSSPFIIYLLGLAWFLKNKPRDFKNFLIGYAIIPSFIILVLLILAALGQRYITDFSVYLTLLAVVSWWLSQDCLPPSWLKLSDYLFISLSIFSLYVSLLLGFGI